MYIKSFECSFRFYQSFILTQLVGINLKKSVIQTLKHYNNISMISIKVIISNMFYQIHRILIYILMYDFI